MTYDLAAMLAYEFLTATSGHAHLLAQLEQERQTVTDNARAARQPERLAARRAYQAAWQRNHRAQARQAEKGAA